MSVLNIYSKRPDGSSIRVGTWISGVAYFDLTPRHFYRNMNAWGVDVDAYNDIAGMDTKSIVLEIHKNGQRRILSTSLACFAANSWTARFHGFSPRQCMAEKLWDVGEPEEEKQMEMFKGG